MNTLTISRIERLLAACIIAAAGMQLIVAGYHAWPFTTDDAFISWRYAQHLAQGHGLCWNLTSPPVEGYSNFAWVIFAALCLKLGLPVILVMKSFACVSLLAAFVFLYRLSRTFFSPLLSTLPIYLLSHYNGVIWWTVSGLETSFYMALVLFVSWQSVRAMGFVRCAQSVAWLWCCLGLTLLALTRFDGIVWCLVVGLFVICHLLRTPVEKHIGRLVLIAIICFGLPYTAYFVWRILYFDSFLPNSFLCKSSTNQFEFELIIDYLVIALPCLILSIPYLLSRKDCRHILLWLPSLIYAVLLYRANPVVAFYNRLFLGAFSVLTIMAVLGVKEYFSYFNFKKDYHDLSTAVVILIITHLMIPGNQLGDINLAVKHYQQRAEMRQKVALQLNQDVAVGAKVLIADCGVIPFYSRSDIQFIDSLCLNNKEMAREKVHHSLALYSKHLQETIKPEWVIDTYYPIEHHGNDLNDELHRNGFYRNYTLIKRFESHSFALIQGKLVEQEPDFVYYLYRSSKP